MPVDSLKSVGWNLYVCRCCLFHMYYKYLEVDYANLLILGHVSGGHEGIDPKAYRTS